jgi:HEAT repeat protein
MDEVEKLIQQLEHPIVSIRWKAADKLGKIGDTRAVAPLIDKLRDKNDTVRGVAARSLGDIKERKAVPGLIGLLRDNDTKVRWETAHALGKIEDARAVPGLIGLLKGTDAEVWVATNALVSIAKKEDVDLREVRGWLSEIVDKEEPQKIKRRALSAYVQIAKAVSERKESNMPGEMLPARIKPKKPGIYRTAMRRAVNE